MTHETKLPGAAHRTRQLRLAVLSSMVSKITGFALQAFSLPLVFHSLDSRAYANYLLVSAILSTLNLAQMGTGPGLTQEIATAAARGNKDDEARFLASAFTLSFTILLLGTSVVFALAHIVPPERLLGDAYAGEQSQIVETAQICMMLVGAHVVLANVDSALAGYQEQVYTSVASSVSNVIAAMLVAYVCRHEPTISTVILATFMPPTISRAINLVLLVFRRRYLLGGLSAVSTTSIRKLVGAGLAFWIIQLSSMIEQNAGVLVLAHHGTASDVAIYGFIYKAVLLGLSGVTIVTQPLWPAYIDARVRRDTEWITRVFRVTRNTLMIFAIAATVLVAATGPFMLESIANIDLGTSGASILYVFAAYFSCNIWAHVHYMAVMGLGNVWRLAGVMAAENGLMLGLALLFAPCLGATGMALAYLVSSACLPLWLLPIMMRRTLRGLQPG